MDPRIFRKDDAPSVLVIEKPWSAVLDKPGWFDEMANRIIAMMEKATDETLLPHHILTRPDTLRKVKEVIWQVLIVPLTSPDYKPTEEDVPVWTKGNILVDAFWDEIPDIPKELKTALERLLKMKDRIDENIENKLTSKSTLMDAKSLINSTVLEPLNGIDYDN